jgi:hypothetical protein
MNEYLKSQLRYLCLRYNLRAHFQCTGSLKFSIQNLWFTGTSSIYRVSQEERSIFWEVIVSVILRKNKIMWTCVLFLTVSDIWRAIFSFFPPPWTITTTNRHFKPIHMLQTFAHYGGREILRAKFKILRAKYRKPFGIGHMFIYPFFLEWSILWPPGILTFLPWTFCIRVSRGSISTSENSGNYILSLQNYLRH